MVENRNSRREDQRRGLGALLNPVIEGLQLDHAVGQFQQLIGNVQQQNAQLGKQSDLLRQSEAYGQRTDHLNEIRQRSLARMAQEKQAAKMLTEAQQRNPFGSHPFGRESQGPLLGRSVSPIDLNQEIADRKRLGEIFGEGRNPLGNSYTVPQPGTLGRDEEPGVFTTPQDPTADRAAFSTDPQQAPQPIAPRSAPVDNQQQTGNTIQPNNAVTAGAEPQAAQQNPLDGVRLSATDSPASQQTAQQNTLSAAGSPASQQPQVTSLFGEANQLIAQRDQLQEDYEDAKEIHDRQYLTDTTGELPRIQREITRLDKQIHSLPLATDEFIDVYAAGSVVDRAKYRSHVYDQAYKRGWTQERADLAISLLESSVEEQKQAPPSDQLTTQGFNDLTTKGKENNRDIGIGAGAPTISDLFRRNPRSITHVPEFEAYESDPQFQGLPIDAKLQVIDSYADAVIKKNGFDKADDIVNFTENLKLRYQAENFSEQAFWSTGISDPEEIRAMLVEGLELIDDQRRFTKGRRTNPLELRAPAATGGYKTPEQRFEEKYSKAALRDIRSLASSIENRITPTQAIEHKIGDQQSVGLKRVTHPYKELYTVTLPDGRERTMEGGREEVIQNVLRDNLDAFEDHDDVNSAISSLANGALDTVVNGVETLGLKANAGVASGMTILKQGMEAKFNRITGGPMFEIGNPDQHKINAGIILSQDTEIGNSIRAGIDKVFPSDPRQEALFATGDVFTTPDRIASNTGGAAAHAGLLVAGNAVAPGSGLGVGASGLLSYLSSGREAAKEAVAAGKPENAMAAFHSTGLATVAIDAITGKVFSKTVGPAFEEVLNSVKPGAYRKLLSLAVDGGVDSLSEGAQTVAANAVAKQFYDENRDIFDGVPESMAMSLLTSAVMSVGAEAGNHINDIQNSFGNETTTSGVEPSTVSTEQAPNVVEQSPSETQVNPGSSEVVTSDTDRLARPERAAEVTPAPTQDVTQDPASIPPDQSPAPDQTSRDITQRNVAAPNQTPPPDTLTLSIPGIEDGVKVPGATDVKVGQERSLPDREGISTIQPTAAIRFSDKASQEAFLNSAPAKNLLSKGVTLRTEVTNTAPTTNAANTAGPANTAGQVHTLTTQDTAPSVSASIVPERGGVNQIIQAETGRPIQEAQAPPAQIEPTQEAPLPNPAAEQTQAPADPETFSETPQSQVNNQAPAYNTDHLTPLSDIKFGKEDIPVRAYEIKEGVNQSILDEATFQSVSKHRKFERPEIETYWSKDQIKAFTQEFDQGAVRFSLKHKAEDHNTAGNDEAFVFSYRDYKQIVKKHGNDLKAIESILGLGEEFLSKNPDNVVAYFISPDKLGDLKIATGNEWGANEKWMPGAKTSGNANEGVMDLSDIPLGDLKQIYGPKLKPKKK